MTKLNNLKKSKKGFTLVEVIVVLVIIAILIAIAVPSLTGYIDKAKEKTVLADARTILMAAQTLTSENYAKNIKTAPGKDAIDTLVGTVLPGKLGTITVDAGKVTGFTYADGGKTATYAAGAFTVA